jgi:excisionase family DNA binding protein
VSAAAEIEPRWLSYREAARYSGLSEMALRRLVEAGRLHAYRPTGGRLVRLDRQELDQVMAATADAETT